MAGKFEIHTRVAEPRVAAVGRYQVIRSERCVSCGECVHRCIYGVHLRLEHDPRLMDEPRSELCRACLVCPQQCPRRALEVRANPELDTIGTPPFDADAVLTVWQEALDGKIPVRGAGYGGRFRGEGFDGIWTDMSEIVRPTRDGIHGREYISTEFDLGRKLPDLTGLRFDTAGRLLDRIPLTREIPVPVLFGRSHLGPGGLRLNASLVRAARELETFAIMDLEQLGDLREPAEPEEADLRAARYVRENRNHIVVRLTDAHFDRDGTLLDGQLPNGENGELLPIAELSRWASVVQLGDGPELLDRVSQLRSSNPHLIVMVEVGASPEAPARVVELARAGVDAIQLACGWRGTWAGGDGSPTTVTEAIRAAHDALVGAGVRNELSLLVSGGISRAEHVPKAILLGADAVVLGVVPLVALGCRVCRSCEATGACVNGLAGLDPAWAVRRIVNLVAAWRNQLLEVLGAMGLRDVRRLRGELGRGLFADELEQEFLAGLQPLEEKASPLAMPAAACMAPGESSNARERMRNRYGLYRIVRGADCSGCGTCARVCPTRALRWPAGLRSAPPPVSELCTGPDCAACVKACPSGALQIEPDERLEVVENRRWTPRLIVETWHRAAGAQPVELGRVTMAGGSEGGFDVLEMVADGPPVEAEAVDLGLELNRRANGPRIRLPLPVYGGGMSYGSVSLQVMVGRARAAAEVGTLTCTGEGGYPDELIPYADHVITQIATGYFGVREETVQRSRVIEFKYAQGAKPGLGGHLLGDKNTPTVARLREAVPGTALFSPFPFHSVYSIEDHRKHVDWVRQVNPSALVSVKVSTPADVEMVAVGSYHAGANIVHLDGSYGGTGAAPEVAKKNIAMPIELALERTHRFLEAEGIRDELVLIASGGVRTPLDVLKAVALGADGVVIGTSELVAISCVMCRNCEKDRGCPRGIATTDPELAGWLDEDWIARRIVNLYQAWEHELRWLLGQLGLTSIRALRGRKDLLRYRPGTGRLP